MGDNRPVGKMKKQCGKCKQFFEPEALPFHVDLCDKNNIAKIGDYMVGTNQMTKNEEILSKALLSATNRLGHSAKRLLEAGGELDEEWDELYQLDIQNIREGLKLLEELSQ